MQNSRLFKIGCLGVALVFALIGTSFATDGANYPNKPVKLIVPFGAGGGSDTTARVVIKGINDNKLFGEPITVINVPGAGGSIGARQVLSADPDGYTFLLYHVALLSREAAGLSDFGYHDFIPVAATVEYSHVLAVAENSRFTSLKDLMDELVKKPGTVVYGANLGGNTHMIGLMLETVHPGAKFRFAQIGGDSAAFAALAGNQVDVAAFSASSFSQFKDAGIRPLAMLADSRWPTLPDLPTATELGVPVSFSHYMYWLAPKGTPQYAIDKLETALQKAMEEPEVKEIFAKRYSSPVFLTGKELAAHLQKKYAWIEPFAKKATPK